jgi:hypothetical protein
MKDITPRVLMKQAPSSFVTFAIGTTPAIKNISATNGWNNVAGNTSISQLLLAYRTYIDLGGYTQNDLTTFVQSVDIQEMRDPLQGGAISPIVWCYDLLTTRRISDAEIVALQSGQAPGYLGSTLDLMEVIYGEHQTYAVNSNIAATFVTTDADTLGSGNPTASDRLHWTRIFVINPSGSEDDPGTFAIYPANLVAQAVTAEEKDLVYIERLRRAYTQERT